MARTPTAAPLPSGGVYIGLFRLARPRRIRVGRLGVIAFTPGLYAYVGSARQHLKARLDRHARRHKRLRWHIDYLSVRSEMIGALALPGGKERECQLAQRLTDIGAEPVPGFGCSDCRCRSHLFWI